MQTKLLVDAIVRQTTVLIGQLCTAAGFRAPLAQVADQVFLGLAKEIEAQGVGRKVAADMFGLALRSYQKKIQRLSESATFRDRSLWEAILDYLRDQGSASRQAIFRRFSQDDEEAVAAVLADLVTSGLAYATGRGANALYGLTSAEDRERLALEDREQAIPALLWVLIYQEGPITQAALTERARLDENVVEQVLSGLEQEGRIRRDEQTGELSSTSVSIPVGAKMGWEAAVFDHFQAVSKAIAAKLRLGPQAGERDVIGGATLCFNVYPGHPLEHRTYALLGNIRQQVNALWDEVHSYNVEHPVAEEQRTKVTFYFGQNVERPNEDGSGSAPELESSTRVET